MERLAFEFGAIIIVYLLGYWMGFRACFDYIKEEIRKFRDEQYKRNNMGDD